MKCKNCEKKLTKDMEIEYSRECCEYFCNPDCATTHYYEYMASRPLMEEEIIELLGEKE